MDAKNSIVLCLLTSLACGGQTVGNGETDENTAYAAQSHAEHGGFAHSWWSSRPLTVLVYRAGGDPALVACGDGSADVRYIAPGQAQFCAELPGWPARAVLWQSSAAGFEAYFCNGFGIDCIKSAYP